MQCLHGNCEHDAVGVVVAFHAGNYIAAPRCKQHIWLTQRIMEQAPEVDASSIAFWLHNDQDGSYEKFIRALPVNVRKELSQALIAVLSEAAVIRSRRAGHPRV